MATELRLPDSRHVTVQLHQGVAYYYNDIEDLKYLMIAKTHASDENDKHVKEMDIVTCYLKRTTRTRECSGTK
eukprot:2309422-Amphidinium_carterae.3